MESQRNVTYHKNKKKKQKQKNTIYINIKHRWWWASKQWVKIKKWGMYRYEQVRQAYVIHFDDTGEGRELVMRQRVRYFSTTFRSKNK